jgi:two-component system, NtrC family, sensor kinase
MVCMCLSRQQLRMLNPEMLRMKKTLSFFLLLGLGNLAIAQSPGLGPVIGLTTPFPEDSRRFADSLQQLLAMAKEDTNKVSLLLLLGRTYRIQHRDTAFFYSRQALLLSQQLNYTKGVFDARNEMTTALRLSGNYASALEFAMANLPVAEQHKDTLRIYMTLMDLCGLHLDMNDFARELAYARKIEALSHFPFFRTQVPANVPPITLAYTINFALAFEGLKQFDSALYYMRRYYSLAQMHKGYSLAVASGNLAGLLLKLGRYDEARSYFDTTLEHARNLGAGGWMANSYLGKARVFHQKGRFDSALHYAKLSLSSYQSMRLPANELKAATLLNELYAGSGRMDSAHRYLSLAAALKDSLFNQEKIKQMQNLQFDATLEEQQKEQEQKETRQRYENRQKLLSLGGGLLVLSLVAFFLYRSNRQHRRSNRLLQEKNTEIEKAMAKLKATQQQQLIQSEKMASLGELTAGIAHEIQNPLNFVNNFSEANVELLDELVQANQSGEREEVEQLAKDIRENEQKITHHGKRADAIVKGMLQHSRASAGEKQATNINALVDEYLRLSYHAMRSKDKNFQASIETQFDESIGKVSILPQEIGRVLLNLYNNAFYATAKKREQLNGTYEPKVVVSTEKCDGVVKITVRDNGTGIPKEAVNKIFQPFFTTKPTGEGTGLGLSLSFDIITKGHGGELMVRTEEGRYAEFVILLSLKDGQETRLGI